MGKSAPSPPTPPDPTVVAQAQGEANENTARVNAALNRVDQYTPYGNITYTDLGNDRWRANTEFSANQQRIADLRDAASIQYGTIGNTALGRVGNIMGTDLDFSGLPQINDGVLDRKRVEDAMFSRMQPGLDNQRNALDTRLRNQGMTPGSEAWNTAMREYGMSENDARLAVINAAGGEQQRLFGMASANRKGSLEELLAQRQIPLNEAAALMGGSQVNYPQFSAVPQTSVAPTDVTAAYGLEQQAKAAGYAGQVGATNSANQATAGLAAAAITAAAIF